VWNPHPKELVGIWELIDIAGEGSLEPIIARSNDAVLDDLGVEEASGIPIKFGTSGEVDIVRSGDGGGEAKGIQWSFRPGPAHLDTCEFTLTSGTSGPETRLRYTGFIDRGQRIESRFSRRPVRMTGRVEATSSYGDVKSSGRFIMLLRRSDQ